MKQILISLILVAALVAPIIVACQKAYAVVPASTSFEEEVPEKGTEQRLVGIIDKLEQRHEDDIRLLESIKSQLKGLKDMNIGEGL